MEQAISAISPQYAQGFFNHCGYTTQVKSLRRTLYLVLAHLSGSAYLLVDRRISYVFHGSGTTNLCF